MHTLAAMTWEEARDAAGPGTVAILPVGAIEAHGPHLPLETDVLIAKAMSRAAASRLTALGHRATLLPHLLYTSAEFARGFPGTISLRPQTVSAVIEDIARSVAAQRFGLLAIANAHLDPGHLDCLTGTATRIRDTVGIGVAFPNLARKPWALRLTEEFKSGACHAGRFETSIILAERPDLVREATRVLLPANPASLSHAIRDGKRSFEEAGGPRAYFGYPADATADEGRATIETLGQILTDAVLAEFAGARDPSAA